MKIIFFLIIILFPAVIILGNFQYLIFNFNFYQKLYSQSNVYQSFNSPNVVNNATQNLLGFYRGKNELDHNFFSNQAILHMVDVKRSLISTLNLFYLSLIVVIVLMSILIRKKQFRLLIQAVQAASLATMIFIILVLAGLSSTFDFLFDRFHQLLFVNNLWLFPKDDTLIKLFPQEFFIEFTNRLAFNIIVTSLTIGLASFVLVRVIKR